MFNFNANNLIFVSKSRYDKCNILILKDRDTNRCYKIHDFLKSAVFETGKPYCISRKVNSADKLYLILDEVKEDKKMLQKSKISGHYYGWEKISHLYFNPLSCGKNLC